MHEDPLGEYVLDERPSFCPHLLELLGGIDQEVEPGPDVVDGDEVEIPFQEWTGCVSDDDYVEVAPLISIPSRGRAEDDRLLRLRQVGRQAPLQRVKIPDDGHAHERILPRGVPGAAQSRYVAARCRGSAVESAPNLAEVKIQG